MNLWTKTIFFFILGLGIAAYYGHLKIVEKLVLSGAQISTISSENAENETNSVSPLYSAIRTGQTEVVKYFIEVSKTVSNWIFEKESFLLFLLFTSEI